MNKMQRFAVQFDSVLMRIRSVYINAILFMKEALSVFSGASNVDSTGNSIEEPKIDTSFDYLIDRGLSVNPSTGLPMISGTMVDIDGNTLGSSGETGTGNYFT